MPLLPQPPVRRAWAMPNRWTFTIQPIAELLAQHVGDGSGWIDPFAGQSQLAQFRNDLNPKMPQPRHLFADKFLGALQQFGPVFEGILFDPPYSGRQVKECYSELQQHAHRDDTNGFFFGNLRRLASGLIRPGGLGICCGWNSNGLGRKNGWEMLEVLIVAHGGSHNDTIVTVERKI